MGAAVGDPVMLVNSSDVTALMRRAPPCRLTTLVEICRWLAQEYQFKCCCTLTAAIFGMIAASLSGILALSGYLALSLPALIGRN